MNLSEFKASMSSDAMVENERLKQDLEDLEKEYDNMSKAYREKINGLVDDCRALAKRCFVTTQGVLCWGCSLHEYRCPREPSFDDKIRIARKIMEETKCTAQNANPKTSE